MELAVFGLLVVVALLAVLARWLHVPYPILLVIGGSLLGFFPGVPDVELDPDLVLLIFLPPLLYAAAFFSNLHELRRNVRHIGLLAIGLVAATMLAVATAAHMVIGLSWPVSFVLGALVAPTDVVAPAEIVRRLGVPRRIVTLIEGESLTNDWTALVLYRFAVAAVVSGSFSLWEAGPKFLLTGLGGVAVGVTAGAVIAAVRRRLDDPPTEITVSLLTAYAAYLPAEELGFSGVIAAVTVGIFMGARTSELTNATTRMQGFAVWEILQFLLNAVLFVLIGLQLPAVLDQLDGRSAGELAAWGVLVALVVICVRIAWVFAFTYLPRILSRQTRDDRYPVWKESLVVAWGGVRGSVSLAAALAIPTTVDAGGPFPDRDLLIFLTYCVIVATLVGQGLTLPLLIHVLGFEDDGLDRQEELLARVVAADRARERIEQLADEEWTHESTVRRLSAMYELRQRRFTSLRGGDESYEGRSAAFQRMTREIISSQRQALLELRNAGRITDEVMRRVERDLDLEESRLEAPV
jgi:monovalent cation/hydrogen antiporter